MKHILIFILTLFILTGCSQSLSSDNNLTDEVQSEDGLVDEDVQVQEVDTQEVENQEESSNTPKTEYDIYYEEMSYQLDLFKDRINRLATLTDDAGYDPSLIYDSEWRSNFDAATTNIILSGENIKNIEPPQGLEEVQNKFDDAMQEFIWAATDFPTAVYSEDIDKIDYCSLLIATGDSKLDEAISDFNRILGKSY